MGREIKRVDLNFQWELKKAWPGFINPYFEACPVCDGDNANCDYGIFVSFDMTCIHPSFAKAYENWKIIEPPIGDGYQMWETTSAGSPVSPVFNTPDELIVWMSQNKYSDWAMQWVQEGKIYLPTAWGYNHQVSFVQDYS